MEFGRHIGKGIWAFADKSLPALYGVGFIFLVVRVLPEEEYGAFAIIQSIYDFGLPEGRCQLSLPNQIDVKLENIVAGRGGGDGKRAHKSLPPVS